MSLNVNINFNQIYVILMKLAISANNSSKHFLL